MSDHCAAGQHEFPSEMNKVILFFSTDDDDDGGGGNEGRTGGAGNSGLRTRPIPRVLLGKVRRPLRTHTKTLHTHPRGQQTVTDGSHLRKSSRMCR